jgi:hypothetical protein
MRSSLARSSASASRLVFWRNSTLSVTSVATAMIESLTPAPRSGSYTTS